GFDVVDVGDLEYGLPELLVGFFGEYHVESRNEVDGKDFLVDLKNEDECLNGYRIVGLDFEYVDTDIGVKI
ncbi:hypothetical protein, partial [Staphylococcus epidermidis]|uniref:hypothetical protein n=1 Tax=Staphylococcus epidermidis TaxID=1282 RepID=UPI001642ECA4